jgi:nitrite reductase/ring-hydroxylating ferredoxin subunit
MADIFVGKEDEFGDRGRKVIAQGDLEIGVFCLDGKYYAWENRCTHQGGPICQGRILNRVEEALNPDKTSRGLKWSESDVHIVCPWHGFEFNIKTGRHPGNKNVRLKPFDVKVQNGEVYVVV